MFLSWWGCFCCCVIGDVLLSSDNGILHYQPWIVETFACGLFPSHLPNWWKWGAWRSPYVAKLREHLENRREEAVLGKRKAP